MQRLALHDFHSTRNAHFDSDGDEEWILSYGDPEREYAALTDKAGLLDLGHRGRLCVLGRERRSFLNGQVTNDVKSLRPGQGCYAALVDAKGKMQSDLNVYCLEEEILLDFEPGLTDRVTQRLESHIIAEDAEIADVRPHYALLSLQGALSQSVLEKELPELDVPKALRNFKQTSHPDYGDLYVMNHPRGGLAQGYDLFVPLEGVASLAERLETRLESHGGRWCGGEALEWIRIENGLPRYGVDMDETTLPPEAGLEASAISYSKGCYIGQEVIARIRTYGQVARRLKGFSIEDGEGLPERGASIQAEDKTIGALTSSLDSPRFGRKIAMGCVKRKWTAPGTSVVISGGGKQWKATVCDLPFMA